MHDFQQFYASKLHPKTLKLQTNDQANRNNLLGFQGQIVFLEMHHPRGWALYNRMMTLIKDGIVQIHSGDAKHAWLSKILRN